MQQPKDNELLCIEYDAVTQGQGQTMYTNFIQSLVLTQAYALVAQILSFRYFTTKNMRKYNFNYLQDKTGKIDSLMIMTEISTLMLKTKGLVL